MSNNLSAHPVFQTREGVQVKAMIVNGKTKLFTSDKKAVYNALEEDLKSSNIYTRECAFLMLHSFELFGLDEV